MLTLNLQIVKKSPKLLLTNLSLNHVIIYSAYIEYYSQFIDSQLLAKRFVCNVILYGFYFDKVKTELSAPENMCVCPIFDGLLTTVFLREKTSSIKRKIKFLFLNKNQILHPHQKN